MELRKYREFEETPKLRVLKKPGDTKEPIKGFITLIIIIISVAVTIAIVNFSEEPETEETLQEFVERAVKETPQKQEKFILGKINPEVGKEIQELTGVDFSKYLWVIENYAIRHIFNKPAHSIRIQDFQKVYSVINTPNEIKLSDKQRSDVKYLELYKEFDFRITCVVEVRTRQKELHIKTMFKNRIK
jgi:hypothetical protein